MALKQVRIESKKIREAAKGEDCTLNIAGVCNYDSSTVVLTHLPDESHGMSRKADDISACFSCSNCHDVIDRRVVSESFEPDREWYLRRAMVRTWRRLIEMQIVSIKDVKID
ncbi:HNH endonuclease [Vibrio phage K250 g1]